MTRPLRHALILIVGTLSLVAPGIARAQGAAELGDDAAPGTGTRFQLDGIVRVRAATYYNLDLDRGVTPSGTALFPVPSARPQSQWVSMADTRVRTDLGVTSPSGMWSARARVDVLDNLVLGRTPVSPAGAGSPLGSVASPGPYSIDSTLAVRRAYGQVLLPVGLLAAGRMGNHWGMGLLASGGDCADCDFGDSADRVAFVTPIAGHLWAVTWDFNTSGPLTDRGAGLRRLDLDLSDNVQALTLAALRRHTDLARDRRTEAGRTILEYGLAVSVRWQRDEVPAEYLLGDTSALGRGDLSVRGYQAGVADAWVQVSRADWRVAAEVAAVQARIDQPSIVPGVEYRVAAESLQFGGAFESEWTPGRVGLGLNAGFASGDPAPGFGAFPRAAAPAPVAGDVDGVQARLPDDHRVDNFRFHPDYRVDRILFRELIGTVTDATYLRPHARVRLWESRGHHVEASVAAIYSQAVEPTSTPGGRRPLGIEIDPTLMWRSEAGMAARLDYAVLFPLAGLDNLETGQSAQPAQLVNLRVSYAF